MAKPVKTRIKLQCPGGQATPAPPIGPALGAAGVNIGEFVNRFNNDTKEAAGTIIPVLMTVYEDGTFDYILKSPPAAVLLKQAANVAAGASEVGKEIVGSVTREQVASIAETKMADLNARDIDAACRIIEGTARSMGIEVES